MSDFDAFSAADVPYEDLSDYVECELVGRSRNPQHSWVPLVQRLLQLRREALEQDDIALVLVYGESLGTVVAVVGRHLEHRDALVTLIADMLDNMPPNQN